MSEFKRAEQEVGEIEVLLSSPELLPDEVAIIRTRLVQATPIVNKYFARRNDVDEVPSFFLYSFFSYKAERERLASQVTEPKFLTALAEQQSSLSSAEAVSDLVLYSSPVIYVHRFNCFQELERHLEGNTCDEHAEGEWTLAQKLLEESIVSLQTATAELEAQRASHTHCSPRWLPIPIQAKQPMAFVLFSVVVFLNINSL